MTNYTNKEFGLLLQSLTSKIDQFIGDNSKEHEEMKSVLTEHNGRLRKSEIWRAYITGALAVVIFLVSGLVLPILVKSFIL